MNRYEDLKLKKEYHNNYGNQNDNYFSMSSLFPGTIIELIYKESDKLNRNGRLVMNTDRSEFVCLKTGETFKRAMPRGMNYKIMKKVI